MCRSARRRKMSDSPQDAGRPVSSKLDSLAELDGADGRGRRVRGGAAHGVFNERAWERRRRAAVDRAFRSVPFYREQWAQVRGSLSEPMPVRAHDLADQLFRLCPLTAPWKPSREPSLWLGDPGALADALALAGVLPRRGPVLEIRQAMVDWKRLYVFANPYGALLSPDADVRPTGRLVLQLRALQLAEAHGGAAVVGTPFELTGVLREADEALGGAAVQWTSVHRLTVAEAQAISAAGPATATVVHDAYLGYMGSLVPVCGQLHLLWKRVHVRPTVDGLVFTRLRGRRPSLISVLPTDPGFSGVGRCAVHGTPVLTP
jgi:hypothetical protein